MGYFTNYKSIIIIFTCFISVMFMSVGYSVLNTELTISGEATVSAAPAIDGIKVTNISVIEETNGAFQTYTPTFTDDTSNLFVTLPNLNSTITFLVEVTNETDIYYHLDFINELLQVNNSIGYEIVNKEAQYFLENSVTELEIRFFHKTDIISGIEQSLNLEYTFAEVPYRRIDYIKYTGKQSLDTGIINTGDYEFELDFMLEGYSGGASPAGGWLISGRTSYSYSLGVFFSSTSVFSGYGGTTTATSKPKALNVWHDLYFSRKKLVISGTSYVVPNQILIPASYARTIVIGAGTGLSSGGIDPRHFIGKVKYVKITDAVTSNLLTYFVPVELNDTNEIGYWDEINNQFHTSSGTEDFLYP